MRRVFSVLKILTFLRALMVILEIKRVTRISPTRTLPRTTNNSKLLRMASSSRNSSNLNLTKVKLKRLKITEVGQVGCNELKKSEHTVVVASPKHRASWANSTTNAPSFQSRLEKS